MWIRGGCDGSVELRVESKGGSSQGNGAKIQADVLPEPPQRAPKERTIPSSVENFRSPRAWRQIVPTSSWSLSYADTVASLSSVSIDRMFHDAE